MTVLVTGSAGFIGYHVARALLVRGENVIGVDNINDYYDVQLKKARLAQLTELPNFQFQLLDLANTNDVQAFFAAYPEINRVIHLAAQAGVRYSLENPHAYIQSNIIGHLNILEGVRHSQGKIAHIVYASSSSVYGENKKFPFSIEDRTDNPASLYAATKKADEAITHSYCHLYNFSATGLRFFTVYGPWGRPDMAAYLFAEAIRTKKPIKVFNKGQMKRDFTYIDDIVAGVIAALDRPPQQPATGSNALHRIYNLGNNQSENLLDFIKLIEREMGATAEKEMLPLQMGDVPETYADIAASQQDLGYEPKTTIDRGIPAFIKWYKTYYNYKA